MKLTRYIHDASKVNRSTFNDHLKRSLEIKNTFTILYVKTALSCNVRYIINLVMSMEKVTKYLYYNFPVVNSFTETRPSRVRASSQLKHPEGTSNNSNISYPENTL